MNSTNIFAPEVKLTAAPKVGDILVGTYGYEACIATFAKVLAVTGKTVKVVELDQQTTYHPNSGGMTWTARPNGQLIHNMRDVPKTKRFTATENGYRIKWSSYQNLYGPWKGDSVECYNYH